MAEQIYCILIKHSINSHGRFCWRGLTRSDSGRLGYTDDVKRMFVTPNIDNAYAAVRKYRQAHGEHTACEVVNFSVERLAVLLRREWAMHLNAQDAALVDVHWAALEAMVA